MVTPAGAGRGGQSCGRWAGTGASAAAQALQPVCPSILCTAPRVPCGFQSTSPTSGSSGKAEARWCRNALCVERRRRHCIERCCRQAGTPTAPEQQAYKLLPNLVPRSGMPLPVTSTQGVVSKKRWRASRCGEEHSRGAACRRQGVSVDWAGEPCCFTLNSLQASPLTWNTASFSITSTSSASAGGSGRGFSRGQCIVWRLAAPPRAPVGPAAHEHAAPCQPASLPPLLSW